MNQKEIGELRRRFRPDKTAISRISGCYVNSQREVISYIDAPLGLLPQEEAEQFLGLLKKAISGSLGKNLIDIAFSNQQVMGSEEHRALMALRDAGQRQEQTLRDFYRRMIDCLDMGDSNYLILMANDAYDVPRRGKDGTRQDDDSDQVFRYFVCAVCPVKDGKPELGYYSGENEFHNCLSKQLVGAPELGFLFPAFDNRCANIYNALFYSRKPEEIHQEFIDGIFRVEPPMSAAEQKQAFQTALADALEDGCSMDVIQSVHERLREQIDAHRESRDPEPLTVSAGDIAGILSDCGVAEERLDCFAKSFTEEFGAGALLNPENLIDSGRYEIKTGDVRVTVDPERSYLVETRIIDGRKYLMIPVEGEAEVNGFPVKL